MSPRARHGFSPKKVFFDVLKKHFDERRNGQRLVRALRGSACEQWINGRVLPGHPEGTPRPHRVSRSREAGPGPLSSNAAPTTPALIIETKLFYGHYTASKRKEKLEELARQIRRNQKDWPGAKAVGLVVSFAYWGAGDRDTAKRVTRQLPKRAALASAGLRNAFGQVRRSVENLAPMKFNGTKCELEAWMEMVELV